jgi:histone deacetylase 6
MRDPGSLAHVPAPEHRTAIVTSTTTDIPPADATIANSDGLFNMPKPSSTFLSPSPPKPSPAAAAASYNGTELLGLTKSIEDEGLHLMVKSSEESDSLMEENSDWSVDDAATSVGLPLASLATGLCYDIRMRYHCEVRPAADVHPEDPRRIYYIYKEICRAGLVEDPEIMDAPRPLAPIPLQRIDVRNATREEVELVHTDEHFKFVSETQSESI